MSRRSIVILVGLLVLAAAGVALRYWPAGPAPQPEPAKQAAPKPEPEPAFTDLSPEAARRLVAERSVVGSPSGKGAAPTPDTYGVLAGGFTNGVDLKDLLSSIYDKDVAAAALVAEVRLADGRRLPATPLLVLAAEPGPTPAPPAEGGAAADPADPAWRRVFATGEPGTTLTPPFAGGTGLPMEISLTLHYFDAADPAFVGGLVGEAENLLSSVTGTTPPLWRDGGTATAAFADFAERLQARASKTVDGLLRVRLDAEAAARTVAFQNADGTDTGRLALRLDRRPARLTGDPDFADLDTRRVDADLTVGRLLRSQEAALTRALTAGADGLAEACTSLHQTLTGRGGLNRLDAAAALATLGPLRALFHPEPALADACLGEAADRLTAATDDTPPLTPGLLSHANQVLGTIGAALRYGPDETRNARLAEALAGSVTVVDHSGMWLPRRDGAPFHGAGAAVDPGAAPAEVAGYLTSLPAAHFACYSTGSGRRGIHRAALVQLQHDAGLWVLDAAFDARGRVIGLSLAPAGRAEVCRAVGQRKQGPDACYFARTGRSYAGIDPGKC